ncbi:uncharacterized protein [Eurosta solidaginis]|uniref:uncharacterized protein isoform X2 n=1 Tax=Eurosta solidaginis TaxID=178769 RepID=UPI003530D9E0
MDSPTFKIGRDRTSGDGMEEEKTYWKIEQEESTEQDAYRSITRRVVSADIPENVHRKASTSSTINTINLLPLPGLPSLYRKPDGNSRSLAPTIPKGELVQLSPRLIKNTLSLRKQNNSRLPKFIPYEPYPGATNQIVTTLNLQSKTPKKLKTNKNNLDIGILVEQMSTMRTDEMGNKNCELKDDIDDMKLDKLKDELRTITKERDYYQGQFRFQTQVNSELKNLLVASVGEDLQTHVNVLTEDKLQLARALLDTANNLTTHSEQIEFLAGQCEVWRSKFLASSVMVEELARWKADLTEKNQMLNESTQSLLHTTHQCHTEEVRLAIGSLNPKSANGPDGISARLVQKYKDELSGPLAKFINECFISGQYPEELKIGSVVPIQKSGSKEVCSNYRPITKLSTIDKVFY